MLRVLIVDDSDGVRVLLRASLEIEGAAAIVGEAADGKAGFAEARRLHPHLVITDIHMPVMNGVELITQLRATNSPARVIAYSSDMHGLAEALAAGADDAVPKQASFEQLLTAVQRQAAEW